MIFENDLEHFKKMHKTVGILPSNTISYGRTFNAYYFLKHYVDRFLYFHTLFKK